MSRKTSGLYAERGYKRKAPLSPNPLDIRDSIFGKYVVRYIAQAESIIMLRVWHHYESR